MIKKYKLAVAVLLTLTASSCKDDLDLKPYNALTTEQIVNTEEGLSAATIGNYNYIKDSYYTRNYHMLSEYASDNVSLSGTTTDALFYAYNYQHLKNQSNTEMIWRKGYQAIYGANVVIEKVTESDNATMNQLLGENYFLRGMIHFDLVKLFGRPYTDDNGESLGIVIKTNSDVKQLSARAKVKDVYALVISDLLKSMTLMGSTKSNIFASKEVAMALLSRVYLYMGDYDNAYKYADEVINTNRYALVSSANLGSYFTVAPGGDRKLQETIFAIKHELKDDRGDDSIGSMYFTSGGQGYGEMYASESYRNLLDKFPNDLRRAFVRVNYKKDEDGNVVVDKDGNPVIADRNGYPVYFVMKYSYQDDVETLSSPVVLRLAEMYLTRAEVSAKRGNTSAALEDVNIIRARAGLKNKELFAADNMMGYTNVLDIVLDERRLEFAFEAQRKFDVFRNKRTMVRDYPGTHLPSGQITQEIPYTSPRVIYYIPQSELTVNPNLVQNPE